MRFDYGSLFYIMERINVDRSYRIGIVELVYLHMASANFQLEKDNAVF